MVELTSTLLLPICSVEVTVVTCSIAVCYTGSQETAVVLQLLQRSMQPLLASLQAWLYAGLLPASPHNFFICQGESVVQGPALCCPSRRRGCTHLHGMS